MSHGLLKPPVAADGTCTVGELAEHAADTRPKLDVVYIKQRQSLSSFLRRRTRCEQASQELLNDIWLRIAATDRTAPPDNPEAFLQRIASNLAGDWLRRRKFRSTLLDPEADATTIPEPSPPIDERLHRQQALEFLIQVIDELPPKRREVFILYRGEGLSVREVATRLGIAEKTVEHQIAKAIVHCRARLAIAGLWP